MKRIVFLLTAVAFVTVSFGQSKKETAKKERIEDKIEQYFFVMLKTGPKQDFDSAQKQVLFKGHMDNINRLYYEGILKVAGPFGKDRSCCGSRIICSGYSAVVFFSHRKF